MFKKVIFLLSTTAAYVALQGATAQDASFVGWAYSEAAGKAFIEREVDEIDDVSVELIGFPWNQMVQNMILRHRSGESTEAIQIQERWMPMLVGLGALQDLNEIYGADALAATVDPGLLAMGQFDGKQYALPWTAGSIALVANGAVLETAGISEAPATMDDFRAALEKIKEAVPDSVPFGLSTANPNLIQVESQIIFWQFGARFFEDGNVSIDTPEAREALEFIVGLVDDGLVAKGNDRNATRALYAQNLVGFYFDPPVARGIARKQSGQGEAFDVNVYPVPTPSTGNGEPPRSVIWAHLLGIMSTGSPDLDAGKKVVGHFALNAETQVAYWNELGLFPTTKEALAQIKTDNYVTDWIELAGTARLDEPASFENSAELRKIIGEEIEAAMLGAKSANDAISAMAKRLEKAM
ncbi:MAG: extracellular solute-binding protein [Rhodobacteraceae bacterium]|nr:extracellular solute-binding protein [Paracoccaceae bacterium]MCY4197107.1 extracellular solute-binding protein [Paracoccaceae bacterium]MCY4326789.1 extracellular solute-binding protein [Paracoccaceae bacterium]